MIDKPEAAARVFADMLCESSYADDTARRNAIVRVLLQFHDAGASASVARIERLEGLLRRVKPWLDKYHVGIDLRRGIDEVLKHD